MFFKFLRKNNLIKTKKSCFVNVDVCRMRWIIGVEYKTLHRVHLTIGGNHVYVSGAYQLPHDSHNEDICLLYNIK